MTDSNWKILTDGEKIAHLLQTCADHKYFKNSEPAFDDEFIKVLMIDYPIDAIRAALIEMHKWSYRFPQKAVRRKRWRATLSSWLRRKKQRELFKADIKTQFKKKSICHGCRRQFDPEVWGSPKPNKCYDCYVQGL